MHIIFGGGLSVQGSQEGEELLVPMPMVELSDHLSGEDFECRKEVDGPIAFVPDGINPSGNLGPRWRVLCFRSRAWTWGFSSTLHTISALSGGFR